MPNESPASQLAEYLIGDLGVARRHLIRIRDGMFTAEQAVAATQEISESVERCVARIERDRARINAGEKTIFLITVLDLHLDPGRAIRRVRTWGWYPTLEPARRVVLGDQADIFERGYYRWAVIEEMGPGPLPEVKGSWWFQAEYLDAYSLHETHGHRITELPARPAEIDEIEARAAGVIGQFATIG